MNSEDCQKRSVLALLPGSAAYLVSAFRLLILLTSSVQISSGQTLPPKFALKKSGLELERPIRIGSFYDVTAPRSAIFGHESGSLEAWVYPEVMSITTLRRMLFISLKTLNATLVS